MSGSEDGERMLWVNNGTLMKSPRLSRVNSGSHTHLISKEMEDQQMLDVQLQIADGGNSSRRKEHSSEISRMLRYLMSKVELMENKRTSKFIQLMEESTNSGILSTLMNGRVSQSRENSMKSSAFTLKETSTLCLNCQAIDISILSTTGIWSSRFKMEERLKSGTSINNL
jgi:hypothetical protein